MSHTLEHDRNDQIETIIIILELIFRLVLCQ